MIPFRFIPILDWASTGHMLWYKQGVCNNDHKENRVRSGLDSLEDCKTLCLETVGCNAIHWQNALNWCDCLECPNPTPRPTQEYKDWQGFHLNQLSGECNQMLNNQFTMVKILLVGIISTNYKWGSICGLT